MKVYSLLYGFSIIVYDAVGCEYEIVGFHNEVWDRMFVQIIRMSQETTLGEAYKEILKLYASFS